jgi:hypothetical protein
MLLIGSRHRRDSCSEAYRFARSGSVPADPKVDLDVPDSSLGVHRSPLRRHDGRCVHCPPGPSPRLRFGTATSRTCSALAVPPGFSGFLRSEWIRRSTRSTVRGFVAPRSRPGGSPRFGHPARSLDRTPTRRSWTSRSIQASSSVASTLRSVPLPGSLRPCRHRASSFRTRSRSPTGVPSRRFEPRSRPCRHGARALLVDLKALLRRRVRCVARDVAEARSLDAPMGFGSTRSDAAALARCPAFAGHFAWRSDPLRRPSTRTSREGRVFRPCLAPATRTAAHPEGWRERDRGGSGVSRRSRLGRIPPRAPKDWRNAGGTAPRGVPPRRAAPEGAGADVIATHLRRDSFATRRRSEERRPVVRARAPHPSAVARVPDAETARRTRAHPEVRTSARHSRTPRRMSRRTPWRAPEGAHRGASRRRHPEVGPWRLVAPASPASWSAGSGQTVIVFTGTAETRSEDEVPPPIRRSE